MKTQAIGGLIFYIIVLWILGYASTGSISPLSAFSSGNLVIKVFAYILLVIMLLMLISLAVGKLFGGVKCDICTFDLWKFVPIHGVPVACPICGKIYHAKCFKAEGCPDCKEKHDALKMQFGDRWRNEN